MSGFDNIASGDMRDHGGGLDAAIARFGGARADWLDLSTGINPQPYPVGHIAPRDWTDLPDRAATDALIGAARRFWTIPAGALVLAAPGASALIARVPSLLAPGSVRISPPTYNEHAAAFAASGWVVRDHGPTDARVIVNPNNPDGRLADLYEPTARLSVIDESFAEVTPAASLIGHAGEPGWVILKSFGKFWGLAGLRLGFAIAPEDMIARLAEALGPWPVSGPALRIGATALNDSEWIAQTRARLAGDAARLDDLMHTAGAALAGGTDLFRLYSVADANALQSRLAERQIWTRVFPYSRNFIRLGLPPSDAWARLEVAM